MAKKTSVKDILDQIFEQRKASRKGRYSLRAFSKDLGISPGRLVAFQKQRNIPSAKTIEKLSARLKLDSDLQNKLKKAVEDDKKNRLINKADVVLKKEDLHIVVNWVPYAIVSLLMTNNFILDPDIVAERLGISKEVATESISKLKKMKLIVEDKGKWVVGKSKITTAIDIPSEMIRDGHKEKLNLALTRMSQVKVDMRDYSSITFPADPRNLAVAKKMLIDFKRNLAETMSRGSPTEVYLLNLQLFPLSHSRFLET